MSMLLENSPCPSRDPCRYENSEMPDHVVDSVDNRLTIGSNLLDAVIEIEDPSKRLLRRRELSPFEQNTTIGERMLRRSIVVPPKFLSACGEIVADEQLVDENCISSALRVTWPPHQVSKP